MVDAEIRTLAQVTTVAVRLETTADQLSAVFDVEMPRVGAAAAEAGATMTGPPFARYHHFAPDHVDLEVGMPVAAAPPGLSAASGRPDRRIGISSLPGGPAAVTTHRGPYDSLVTTYDGLAAWIASDGGGFAAGDGPWEVYLTDPGSVPDPADWLTEVVWPLVPSEAR
jgi:effector-binding domain-containing protein